MTKKSEWKTRVRALADKVKADGCTNAPDFFYEDCCDAHDIAYRTGFDENGSPITRATADARLFNCMRSAGKTPVIGKFIIPAIYWTAVRLAGWKYWKGG